MASKATKRKRNDEDNDGGDQVSFKLASGSDLGPVLGQWPVLVVVAFKYQIYFQSASREYNLRTQPRSNAIVSKIRPGAQRTPILPRSTLSLREKLKLSNIFHPRNLRLQDQGEYRAEYFLHC